VSLLILLISSCVKSLERVKINIPPEPEYAPVQIVPCQAIIPTETTLKLYRKTETGVYEAFCLSEESMFNLMENIVRMEIYRLQILELLAAVAEVEEDHE